MLTSSSLARTAIIASILTIAPTVAMADLKSEMKAYVVTTDSSGLEDFSAAEAVKPGQVIEYRLRHTNTFENAIGGVAVTGPVPEGSELLVDRSSSDVSAVHEVRGEFDPDQPGEEWSTLPAQRIVVEKDGTRKVETAKPEHFTAVRWRLDEPMQENASVEHAYRVIIK